MEKLSCSICLDLLRDPVTIPCGHSYCMDCIRSYWDGDEKKKESLRCPQCRQMFRTRPELKKNTVMVDLLEEMKQERLQSAGSGDVGPGSVGPGGSGGFGSGGVGPGGSGGFGSGGVFCDFCTGRKLKAVKSCLQCLVSYCHQHLQPHYQSAAFKKHKLIEPSRNLQENICSAHGEVMKMFCCSDQQCICFLCSLDEHEGHETISAAAERNHKQRVVGLDQEKIQKRIQDGEKDLRKLQQKLKDIDRSADEAVVKSEETFKHLICLIQRRSLDVKQQIRSKQTDDVRKVQDLQEKLKRELVELRRRSSEMKQLSKTEDHIQFLRSYPLLPNVCRPTNISIIDYLQNFEDVTEAVAKTRDKLQEVLKDDESTKTPARPSGSGTRRRKRKKASKQRLLKTLSTGEPTSRSDFLQYFRLLSLDPNSVHQQLVLSEGNRKATVSREIQSYSDHPDRFVDHLQVLSRESLIGRCYWEAEQRAATVAVSYRNISRTGPGSEFGYNDGSWALENSFFFIHDGVKTLVSDLRSSRIGVYLDHDAGILSFYRVSESMNLIHRVQTSFTEPLHAGLRVDGFHRFVELCELK